MLKNPKYTFYTIKRLLKLAYQYILDKFYLFKSPKTFRVIMTIILCCPCYMPKYVPRLESIMHSPSGRALYLLSLGHISAYNMDNTILLYKVSYKSLPTTDKAEYTIDPPEVLSSPQIYTSQGTEIDFTALVAIDTV